MTLFGKAHSHLPFPHHVLVMGKNRCQRFTSFNEFSPCFFSGIARHWVYRPCSGQTKPSRYVWFTSSQCGRHLRLAQGTHLPKWGDCQPIARSSVQCQCSQLSGSMLHYIRTKVRDQVRQPVPNHQRAKVWNWLREQMWNGLSIRMQVSWNTKISTNCLDAWPSRTFVGNKRKMHLAICNAMYSIVPMNMGGWHQFGESYENRGNLVPLLSLSISLSILPFHSNLFFAFRTEYDDQCSTVYDQVSPTSQYPLSSKCQDAFADDCRLKYLLDPC